MLATLYKADKWLIFVAIAASLAISAWANIVDDVINNDGIEYLKSARLILAGEWTGAVETYKWPFYAGAIAFTSLITGATLEHAAAYVNALFFAWLVIAYLGTLRLLGADRSTLWLGLLVVLAFPTLNKIRPWLIRDPAFLAFFMSGTYFFLRYHISHQLRDNIGVWVTMLLGALFRIESLVFLVAMQSYFLSGRLATATNRWAIRLFYALIAIATLILVSWWHFEPTGNLTYLSIFSEPGAFLETVWAQVLDDVGLRLHAIRTKLLVNYSSSHTATVFIVSALTIVALEIIDKLYVIYFLLFIAAWRIGLRFPNHALYRPWRFLVCVGIAILFGFVLIEWFLSDRYPLAVSMLILLYAPILLNHLLQNRHVNLAKGRWFWFLMVLIVLSGLKGLDLYTHKANLKQAGRWLKYNVAEDAKVYTNDRILAHYAERNNVHTAPYWPDWEHYKIDALLARPRFDYLAFYVKRDHPDYATKLPILLRQEPIQVFDNGKGAKVVILEMRENRLKGH